VKLGKEDVAGGRDRKDEVVECRVSSKSVYQRRGSVVVIYVSPEHIQKQESAVPTRP